MIRKHKIGAFLLGLLLTAVAYAGLETVTHIQDLNASWPLGSDLASTSDDHIRNIKSALKTDFPNFNGTYTSAALPVFAIPSDTNTGMYSVGADDLGFSTGGTLRFDISTTALTSTLPALGPAGSNTAPTWSFSGDSNTGAYSVGADDWGITTGGTLRFDISTSAFTGTLPWRGQDGSSGAPALSFSADTDTGVYRSTANVMGFSAGGTGRAFVYSQGLALIDGAVGAPSLFFDADQDTGFYRQNANEIRVALGGAVQMIMGSTFFEVEEPFFVPNGSAANPSLAFAQDTDTGFYRDTANQIGIALGGSTAGQIAQGTYTATITGCTTSPTVTVTYQRIGKMVMLEIPTITCTSNTSQFTLTGAPAVITPASTTGTSNAPDTQDSGTRLFSSTVTLGSTGILVFSTGGNSSGWTAAGVKGIPVATQLQFLLN